MLIYQKTYCAMKFAKNRLLLICFFLLAFSSSKANYTIFIAVHIFYIFHSIFYLSNRLLRSEKQIFLSSMHCLQETKLTDLARFYFFNGKILKRFFDPMINRGETLVWLWLFEPWLFLNESSQSIVMPSLHLKKALLCSWWNSRKIVNFKCLNLEIYEWRYSLWTVELN